MFIVRAAVANSSLVGARSRSGRNALDTASFWIIGVSTLVGCTEFTRIPCGASSLARVRIKPTTPCLAAV